MALPPMAWLLLNVLPVTTSGSWVLEIAPPLAAAPDVSKTKGFCTDSPAPPTALLPVKELPEIENVIACPEEMAPPAASPEPLPPHRRQGLIIREHRAGNRYARADGSADRATFGDSTHRVETGSARAAANRLITGQSAVRHVQHGWIVTTEARFEEDRAAECEARITANAATNRLVTAECAVRDDHRAGAIIDCASFALVALVKESKTSDCRVS